MKPIAPPADTASPPTRMRGFIVRPVLAAVIIFAACNAIGGPATAPAATGTADEVHYTFTGPTSVAFDWRGSATTISYGLTQAYGLTETAHVPDPLPFSSAGPFQEVQLTGLQPGTQYHYSIGGGPDSVFETAPTGAFRFDVIADVGSSRDWTTVVPTQNQVAADNPDFVLVPGDLTLRLPARPAGRGSALQRRDGLEHARRLHACLGQSRVGEPRDRRPAQLQGPVRPAQRSTQSAARPAAGCCGEDWGWFDAGGVRFISYPEPYDAGTWTGLAGRRRLDVRRRAGGSIRQFIVTFGHRPAYSTGFHAGDVPLATHARHFRRPRTRSTC